MIQKRFLYPLLGLIGIVMLVIAVSTEESIPPTLLAIPDFTQYTNIKQRKLVFFDYFQPIIEKHNQYLIVKRERIQHWRDNRENLNSITYLNIERMSREYGMKKFDVNNDEHWQALLARIDIVPVSLALAQAAMESAWGTSRFARNANNYFGQWCFTKDCGIVPLERDTDASHEVKSFDSPEEAVIHYVHNLNTHRAYKLFREIRVRLRNNGEMLSGLTLADGLVKYSSQGKRYVKEVRSVIIQNQLMQYDEKLANA